MNLLLLFLIWTNFQYPNEKAFEKGVKGITLITPQQVYEKLITA